MTLKDDPGEGSAEGGERRAFQLGLTQAWTQNLRSEQVEEKDKAGK